MATRTEYVLWAIGGTDNTPVKSIVTGTYSRATTTGVVTVTRANHGYKKGDNVYFKGTAGTNPPVGEYVITSVANDNTFTFTDTNTTDAVSAQACEIGGGGTIGVAKPQLVGTYFTEALAQAKASALRTSAKYENVITYYYAITNDY
jgi:hypothetical protein